MFYHLNEHDFEPGDILSAGSWGKGLRQFTWAVPPTHHMTVKILCLEIALESVRLTLDENLPSRLDCVFVSEDLPTAQAFKASYRPAGKIYEVTPIGEPLKTFRGDFALISSPRNGAPPYIDYMPAEALAYWTTPATKQPEILYPGDLRIVAKL